MSSAAASRGRPTIRRGFAPALLLPIVIVAAGIAVGGALIGCPGTAWAQAGAAGDTYSDPLAFFRLDPEARNLPLTVDYRGEGDSRLVSCRMLLMGSEEIYVRSATVATIFKASRFWQGTLRRLTLQIQERTFRLTANSRLVSDGQNETLLPTPVLAIDGDLWLPMSFLVRVVGPAVRQVVLWDREGRRLAIGSVEYSVTRLRVERLTRATAVHIFCTQPLSFRADSPEPGYVQLKIYNGEVDPVAVGKSGRSGLVESVRSRQFNDHAMIYLRTDDLVGSFRTYTRQEGREIVLVLEEEQIAALPEPVPRGRANLMVDLGPMDVTRSIDVRTVVVDPGHGGSDVGTVGHNRTYEKNVNLEVAKRLKRLLERQGFGVVMTRDDDRHVALAERAEIANNAGGDCFISLHCNAWYNDGAKGVETYFLSPAKSDWSQSVEATENQAGAQTDDVDFIVWELVQNRFISSSSDLAEVVQRSVSERLDVTDRGVRQAGFRVLVGAFMPAVLVEMGFLSNPGEERRLGRSSYQQDIAEAIAEAVVEFRDRYNRAVAADDADGARTPDSRPDNDYEYDEGGR